MSVIAYMGRMLEICWLFRMSVDGAIVNILVLK